MWWYGTLLPLPLALAGAGCALGCAAACGGEDPGCALGCAAACGGADPDCALGCAAGTLVAVMGMLLVEDAVVGTEGSCVACMTLTTPLKKFAFVLSSVGGELSFEAVMT